MVESKIKEALEKYEKYFSGAVQRFIKSNKRVDRDSVIEHQAKIKLCKELLS